MTVDRGRRVRVVARLHAPPILAAASLVAAGLILTGCGSADKFARKVDPKYGVPSSPRVVEAGQPVPKGGGTYRVGKPYVVGGRNYVPEENARYAAEGQASWYGDAFHGRLTANGEVFDKEAVSAAHPTLPMPSYVRVTNLSNRKSLVVRVNDRGPFHSNRVIDVSSKAAHLLGFKQNGVARVRVEYVGPASLEGSDDRKLIATLRHGAPAPSPVLVASAAPSVPALAGLARPSVPQAGRGTVPVPGERPFSLGEPTPALSSEMTSVARIRRTADAGPQDSAPVSTSLAPRYGAPVGVISGRGLY
jgi:rare lipoprotein A